MIAKDVLKTYQKRGCITTITIKYQEIYYDYAYDKDNEKYLFLYCNKHTLIGKTLLISPNVLL